MSKERARVLGPRPVPTCTWGLWAIALALSASAGCGSDGPSAHDEEVSNFVGTWKTTTGTQETFDCQLATDGKGKVENVTLTYTITKGTDSDLVLSNTAATSCQLKASVVGARATLLPKQTCSTPASTPAGAKDVHTYATSSAFEIAADPKMATLKLESMFERFTGSGTSTGYICGFTESSPLAKQ